MTDYSFENDVHQEINIQEKKLSSLLMRISEPLFKPIETSNDAILKEVNESKNKLKEALRHDDLDDLSYNISNSFKKLLQKNNDAFLDVIRPDINELSKTISQNQEDINSLLKTFISLTGKENKILLETTTRNHSSQESSFLLLSKKLDSHIKISRVVGYVNLFFSLSAFVGIFLVLMGYRLL